MDSKIQEAIDDPHDTPKNLPALGSSTSSNVNLFKVEVAALGAENIDTLSALLGHGAMDVVQVDVGDWGRTTGLTGRAIIGVILLDDDTIVGDTGHGDVRVRDIVDLAAGRIRVGLDTHCVRRVHNRVSLDHDAIHHRLGFDRALFVNWIEML